MKNLILFLALVFMMYGYSYGIRIPLEGGTGTAVQGSGAVRIGMVDIEMIFREFPETRRGKGELEKEINAAQIKIEEKETEIEALQKEVDEMNAVKDKTGNLPGMALQQTTTDQALTEGTTVFQEPDTKSKEEDQKDFEKLHKSKTELLTKKKEELERFKKESELNLLAFEERRSKEILEKLYRNLEKIAREEGLDIVLDKNYVLYGQPVIDLTEKLKKRLAGE